MRFAVVFISLLFFSSCSRGKSPQGAGNSEQNWLIGATDSAINITRSTGNPGFCSFSLVTDLTRGVNGTYSCNYRKTSYRFYLQNPHSWGFQVLLCDMGKSVYMDSIYPEAREDYKGFATRTWLWDSILGPVSRNIGTGNMVLMGLSTGARGSVLLGMEHQNEVGAVVALSGDYFPNFDPDDKLMINSMGPYSRFKNRWEKGKNDVRSLDGMPDFVFLAHGIQDSWVNLDHTIRLKQRLTEIQTTEKLEAQFADGKHDYAFWNAFGLEGLRRVRVKFKSF